LRKENAVAAITTAHPFVVKHQAHIQGVLSCFDRVIFRGYLPFCHPRALEGFLAKENVLLKNFKTFAPQVAERLKQHVKTLVEQAGAPFRHLPSKTRMEEEARRLLQAHGQQGGIVCGFSCLETCRTFRLQYAQGRPCLKKDFRRCLVLYIYLLHATLGLIHVKLETWFPLTMQVYVNGHDWLARKLDRAGISYRTCDNALVDLSDPAAAQACADRFPKQNWPKLLSDLVGQFNPLLGDLLRGLDYYWCVDQAEYATDVIFTSAAALAALYPRLLEHATLCLGAEDVLKFLGRKLTPQFLGEVQTQRSRRVEGACVKHRVGANRSTTRPGSGCGAGARGRTGGGSWPGSRCAKGWPGCGATPRSAGQPTVATWRRWRPWTVGSKRGRNSTQPVGRPSSASDASEPCSR
jgi:hypothetical protein